MSDERMTTVRVVRGGTAIRADLLVIPVIEEGTAAALRGQPAVLARRLTQRAKGVGFRGRPEDALIHHGDQGTTALLGIGAPQADAWRRLGARARREAERQRARRVVVRLPADVHDAATPAIVAEGFLLAGYRFDRYRREPARTTLPSLTIVAPGLASPGDAAGPLAGAVAVATQVFVARDMVNEPPSVATPRRIAEHARALATAGPGLTVEVWDAKRIAREGLSGLLAVARGSAEEPRFITLRYKGKAARKRIALVGKGISFDSGGLSLKPAKSMETMKYDMAGGAAVLSATAAAAALALPVDVTAYVPLTENMPGGRAQKPGDVIRFANDKTVEVLNTDAEGRLVLADALVLASRAKPDVIVDLATLTGAVRVALGGAYAAVMGTDQALVDALLGAGIRSGELLWQLPLVREYRDDLKSPIADLRNVGGGDAGTIIAGLFLAEFVDGVPWAHLDIATTAFAEKEAALGPRGATGYGVRLLVEYLRSLTA